MGRWVVAAALALVVAVGCKGNVAAPPTDGGGRDQSLPDTGTDSSGSCRDDGTRNKGNGEACACGVQCNSGFCVDGFCCSTACQGTCMSCGLPTALGTCTPTPAGIKPRVDTQCVMKDASTCGLDGTCDGTGKCRNYPSLTVCQTGVCDTDSVSNTRRCDGAGNCRLGAAIVCAPFSCDTSTNKCFATCASDADCVSGRRCINGSCGLKMNGASCKLGTECASSHCTDGVCCNTACGGACRSCNLPGLEGSCSPTPAGMGHPLCLKQDPSTCGTTGVCDGFLTCVQYPANTPCGSATCSGTTEVNTARTCDGLGSCQASEVHPCGNYRCENGACDSTCTTIAQCAAGIACLGTSCGTFVDGQACTADGDCANQHCVDGVCCNTACTGACRSCALGGGLQGKCTLVANGTNDPRGTCVDLTAAMCSTDGKCDGAGGCRKYPATTTICSPETCLSNVYTGPSTCNASGQCIKPTANTCFPYTCNATKCFTACSTNAECQTPNVCGMNNMISSCGLKTPPQACSADNECTTGHCSQGVCCNSACNAACQACNLAGTMGSCTNVASGADPQGLCAAQAASTCGTTGQCAAGQCARWASGTQCIAASCPTGSTRTPPSTCNGTGTCVTPATMACAPGRCDATTLTCLNTCTMDSQCTAPATCSAGGSCGLKPAGGTCTATNECAAGLTCFLTEGSPGVCCNTACTGTCESCRLAGTVGTCSPVAAGVSDPDPASACIAAADPTTCGLDGRCAGNNTATNGAGTARCQFLSSAQGCRNRSCVAGTATTAATETEAATCSGAGTCPTVVTVSCAPYNKCTGPNIQCATSCASNADCVAPVTCNTQTGHCGDKLGIGAACGVGTDCTLGNCVDGVCCNSACGGTCQACNNPGSVGTCSNVAVNTPDAMCNPTAPPCGHTGLCTGSGTCANTAVGTVCATAICTVGTSTRTPPRTCDGTGSNAGACPVASSGACAGGLNCAADGASCLTSCGSSGDCAGVGVTCFLPGGTCGSKLVDGQACVANSDCTNNHCVDGFCCNSTCGTACKSCGLPGLHGVCTDVNSGPDPHSMCPTTGTGCAMNTGLCTVGGTCEKVSGVACNDGNSCTQSDTCQGGNCVGSNPVTCSALDQCHDAGTCDPANGTCSNPNKSNGVACNDGSACTQTDTCQAGTCTGSNPVTCSALDQCHDAGTCNPANGTCSNPNKAGGSPCDDSNLCTQTDACQAGVCVGANPMVCPPASDQCHDVGVCNPASGICSNPNVTDGTSCSIGGGDTCCAGMCVVGPSGAGTCM